MPAHMRRRNHKRRHGSEGEAEEARKAMSRAPREPRHMRPEKDRPWWAVLFR